MYVEPTYICGRDRKREMGAQGRGVEVEALNK
jgi:hypothetical protein